MSQFTLAANLRGNRQGFSTAAAPNEVCAIDEIFSQDIGSFGIQTTNGVFDANMAVFLVNDGPMTIWAEVPTPA